jgi:NADPH:quinone reductase-like Zn-dependent oxidoreductase
MKTIGQAVRLQMARPGLPITCSSSVDRRLPGPDEIEIEVRAGLEYREVLKALRYPDTKFKGVMTFDGDCSAAFERRSKVTGFEIGDEVLALGADVFATHTIQPASHASRKPPRLSHAEAATIPVVFATAYYALHKLARLRQGETVLIHSAAGGVGLAAVQWAQFVGADIFATAGDDRKREYLRSLDIEHVMDSRSFDFVEQTLEATEGRGVDVVLNSLAGEFLPKSLSLLAPFGRFLEVGKMEFTRTSLWGLSVSATTRRFSASTFADDIGPAGKTNHEILGYLERNQLQPLEHQVFPMTGVAAAFRLMRQSRHIGKVVVSIDEGFTI